MIEQGCGRITGDATGQIAGSGNPAAISDN